MDNVLTFRSRPRSPEPVIPEPQPEGSLRARIEAAAEVAVDTAERLIAILDQWDGDADLEPDADAEPSLAAPENHHVTQVGWCRGNDGDREAEAPEIALPEVVIVSPVPKLRLVQTERLPWGGEGNVVAFAGVALLALVVGA